MTIDQYDQFKDGMKVLAEVSEHEATDAKLKIYWEIFKEYPLDDFLRGVSILVKTRTTASFPKPAEIIQAFEGVPDDHVALAVSSTRKAIREVGMYKSVTFEDVIINQVIDRLGGWVYVCNDFDWEYRRKEFEQLYEAIKREGGGVSIKYLLGQHEINNAKQFSEWIKPPLRVLKSGVIDESLLLEWKQPRQLVAGEHGQAGKPVPDTEGVKK